MILLNNVIQVFKKYSNVVLPALPLKKSTASELGVVLVIEYTEPQRSGSSNLITSALLPGPAAIKNLSEKGEFVLFLLIWPIGDNCIMFVT
jgi:hypothetical protein